MLDWIWSKNNIRSNGKYNFHIQVQPKFIQTNSNIVITCYSNKNKNSVIPCKYVWSKQRNSLNSIMNNVKGSTYLCEPSDVGYIIRAQITSLDEQAQGKAMLQFGPVKVDMYTKKNLESILSSGIGHFLISIIYKNQQKQCSLQIADLIKIKDNQSEKYYCFPYTIYEPRFQLVGKDHKKILIKFGSKSEDQFIKFIESIYYGSREIIYQEKNIQIKFMNRSFRDTFLLSHKCLIARKQLKFSLLVQKIENNALINEQNINYLMEIQSNKSDLNRLIDMNEELVKQKQSYRNEVKRLEQQMKAVMLTYTKLNQQKSKNINESNQSFSILTSKRDSVLQKKYRDLQLENREIKLNILKLNEQIEYLKTSNNASGIYSTSSKYQSPFSKKNIDHHQQKLQELIKINKKLNQQNSCLKLEMERTIKEKSMLSILDQLNNSNIESNDNLINSNNILKKDKQNLETQIQLLKRKNQDLERMLKMPNNQKVIYDKNGNPLIQLGQSWYGFENINHMLIQINQLKKRNQILFNDNKILFNRSNSETALNQQLKLQNIKLRQNIKSNQTPADSNNNQMEILRLRLENTELQQARNIIQSKYNELVKFVNELQKKNSSIEFQIKYLKANVQENTDVSKYKEEITKLLSVLQQKHNIIQQLQQQLKSRKTNDDKINSGNNLDNTKYIKKIDDLQKQIRLLKKGNDVMNKSRDLTLEMDNYYQEQNKLLKQQNQMLTIQNEKLIKMCEKHLQQAKECNKLRSEVINLKKQLQGKKNNLEQKSTLILKDIF